MTSCRRAGDRRRAECRNRSIHIGNLTDRIVVLRNSSPTRTKLSLSGEDIAVLRNASPTRTKLSLSGGDIAVLRNASPTRTKLSLSGGDIAVLLNASPTRTKLSLSGGDEESVKFVTPCERLVRRNEPRRMLLPEGRQGDHRHQKGVKAITVARRASRRSPSTTSFR